MLNTLNGLFETLSERDTVFTSPSSRALFKALLAPDASTPLATMLSQYSQEDVDSLIQDLLVTGVAGVMTQLCVDDSDPFICATNTFQAMQSTLEELNGGEIKCLIF